MFGLCRKPQASTVLAGSSTNIFFIKINLFVSYVGQFSINFRLYKDESLLSFNMSCGGSYIVYIIKNIISILGLREKFKGKSCFQSTESWPQSHQH